MPYTSPSAVQVQVLPVPLVLRTPRPLLVLVVPLLVLPRVLPEVLPLVKVLPLVPPVKVLLLAERVQERERPVASSARHTKHFLCKVEVVLILLLRIVFCIPYTLAHKFLHFCLWSTAIIRIGIELGSGLLRSVGNQAHCTPLE